MIVRCQARSSSPDVVEQHGFEIVDEGRFHKPPHILVATETVGKKQSAFGCTANPHIVTLNYAH
jgi:hypothetical protein